MSHDHDESLRPMALYQHGGLRLNKLRIETTVFSVAVDDGQRDTTPQKGVPNTHIFDVEAVKDFLAMQRMSDF